MAYFPVTWGGIIFIYKRHRMMNSILIIRLSGCNRWNLLLRLFFLRWILLHNEDAKKKKIVQKMRAISEGVLPCYVAQEARNDKYPALSCLN